MTQAKPAAQADDAHGEEHDVVSQHYGISKTDLTAAIALAASTLDGRHAVPGQLHSDCPSCAAAMELGRVRSRLGRTSAVGWKRS